MLSLEELEQFLVQLLRRGRALGQNGEEQLQQLARAGAQELQARLGADRPAESIPQPEGTEETVEHVSKLPTPPQPQENREGLFDPQRDISPG